MLWLCFHVSKSTSVALFLIHCPSVFSSLHPQDRWECVGNPAGCGGRPFRDSQVLPVGYLQPVAHGQNLPHPHCLLHHLCGLPCLNPLHSEALCGGLELTWEGRWPALPLSLCRVLGRKSPVFLELLRMATAPDPPLLASGHPVLPSPPSGPRTTRFWIWTLLWSGWKGAEANWEAGGGGCLHHEIFINPPQPLSEETLALRGHDALPHILRVRWGSETAPGTNFLIWVTIWPLLPFSTMRGGGSEPLGCLHNPNFGCWWLSICQICCSPFLPITARLSASLAMLSFLGGSVKERRQQMERAHCPLPELKGWGLMAVRGQARLWTQQAPDRGGPSAAAALY